MAQMDAIDAAILRTVQQNGRISNAELAERVGLSPSACSRRLDILEKSGVINAYEANFGGPSNALAGESADSFRRQPAGPSSVTAMRCRAGLRSASG